MKKWEEWTLKYVIIPTMGVIIGIGLWSIILLIIAIIKEVTCM